ncbi:hypothetical protein L0N00_14715, partial [Eggerthella lenta]|nr:hypothetical protein [Eggerthella lenta]
QQAAIKHKNNKISLRNFFAAARYAKLLNGFFSLSQACSVCQAYGQTVKIACFFQKITRCAGDIGHKRALAP